MICIFLFLVYEKNNNTPYIRYRRILHFLNTNVNIRNCSRNKELVSNRLVNGFKNTTKNGNIRQIRDNGNTRYEINGT